MTDKSLLAAVHAAANEPASPPAAAITSQTEDNSMTDKTSAPAAPATITSVAALQAAYPALCKEMTDGARAEGETAGKTAGATAERERITGIEKLAADMPGHDKLIAGLKADGKTTPEQAAMQLIAADGEVRRNALKGVQSVEDKTGKVAASPATVSPAPEGGKTEQANTPEGWKAEYNAQTDAGEKLRAEFPTEGSYVGFKRSMQPGNVVTFGPISKSA